MKYTHLIWAGVFLLISGCAAIGPATVENGIYVNPACQFSLHIPTNWEVSEDIPEFFKKRRSFLSDQNFKAVFYDLDNQSFILVAAEKTKADWVSFKMYSDKFIKSLDEFFSAEKNKYLKKDDYRYYYYEIYNSSIENCTGHCVASKIDFQFQDLKATGHNIIYKSRNGMLYSVSVILVARESKYESNLDVFQAIMDSFRPLI